MKAEFVQLPTVATEKAKKKRKNEDDIDAKNSAKRSCLPKLEIRPLNTVETDLIHSLLLSQNEFEHPSVVTVELLVMFIKRLPDFQKFCQNDQVILLKAASSETMMIRTARRYDPVHDTILVSNNDAYDMAGLRNDDLFQFCRKVSKLEVDNEEFAILTAMTVFSEREKLMELEKVEQIQAEYASVLRAYVLYNKPKPIVRFGSLLNLVVDIRNRSATLSLSVPQDTSKSAPPLTRGYVRVMGKTKRNPKIISARPRKITMKKLQLRKLRTCLPANC